MFKLDRIKLQFRFLSGSCLRISILANRAEAEPGRFPLPPLIEAPHLKCSNCHRNLKAMEVRNLPSSPLLNSRKLVCLQWQNSPVVYFVADTIPYLLLQLRANADRPVHGSMTCNFKISWCDPALKLTHSNATTLNLIILLNVCLVKMTKILLHPFSCSTLYIVCHDFLLCSPFLPWEK